MKDFVWETAIVAALAVILVVGIAGGWKAWFVSNCKCENCPCCAPK